MQRRREQLTLRWDRLNREDRREGLSIRFRRRWYLLLNRIERLDALFLIRWYRFLFGVLDRWEQLAVSFLALGHVLGRPIAAPRERLSERRAARSGHGSASHGGALVAGVLSVALAVTLIALLPLERDVPRDTNASVTDPPAPAPSITPAREGGEFPPGDLSFDRGTYTNELGGYEFSYPDEWDVSTLGIETVLSDPDGQVVISFDGAPSGSLRQASDQVLERFTDSYVFSEPIATELDRTPQGFRSMVVGGTAEDGSGAGIRFLVITIQGPQANQAILVRFPADTEPGDLLDAVLGVVGSFRITQGA
jgi:hypothetical protein